MNNYPAVIFDSQESQQGLTYFPFTFLTPPMVPAVYWSMLHYLLDHGGHVLDHHLEQRDRWRLEAMTRRNMVILNNGWWSLTAYGFHLIQPIAEVK